VGIKNGVFKSALFYCGSLKPPLFFGDGDLAVQINRFLEWVNRPYLICFGVSQAQSVYRRGL
jgi:hypothetical protein